MSRLKLSMLFTAFIYALSQAVVCVRAPALLPTISDCIIIVEAIEGLSRMHGENTMRAWGRRLPTTPDTQKVPKVFWISGRGPTTCAVHVDVDEYNPLAVDDFRVSDVAAAGKQVVAQCLIARSKIGLAYPAGVDGHVYAKIVRTDSPFELESFNQSNVQTFVIPGKMETLHLATINPTLSLPDFNLVSNTTTNLVQVD